MISVFLYAVRDSLGQYAQLDDDWTDSLTGAAYFLTPAMARAMADRCGASEVVKVIFADDWTVLRVEVVS